MKFRGWFQRWVRSLTGYDELTAKIELLTEAPSLTLDKATLRHMPDIAKMRDHYLKKLASVKEPEELRYFQGVVTALNIVIDLPGKRHREADAEQARIEEEEQEEAERYGPGRDSGRFGRRGFRVGGADRRG